MIRYHSPCISVCELDEQQEYCIGCKRSLDEIAEWLTYTEEERIQKLGELKTRNIGND